MRKKKTKNTHTHTPLILVSPPAPTLRAAACLCRSHPPGHAAHGPPIWPSSKPMGSRFGVFGAVGGRQNLSGSIWLVGAPPILGSIVWIESDVHWGYETWLFTHDHFSKGINTLDVTFAPWASNSGEKKKKATRKATQSNTKQYAGLSVFRSPAKSFTFSKLNGHAH